MEHIIQPLVRLMDDGNEVDTDACTNACELASCGDGIIQTGVETCDDANRSMVTRQDNACETARCGDGVHMLVLRLQMMVIF